MAEPPSVPESVKRALQEQESRRVIPPPPATPTPTEIAPADRYADLKRVFRGFAIVGFAIFVLWYTWPTLKALWMQRALVGEWRSGDAVMILDEGGVGAIDSGVFSSPAIMDGHREAITWHAGAHGVVITRATFAGQRPPVVTKTFLSYRPGGLGPYQRPSRMPAAP